MKTYNINGISGFTPYDVALDCASTAAARDVDGVATAEGILEVMKEFHSEIPVTLKVAQRAATRYNNAAAQIAEVYAS